LIWANESLAQIPDGYYDAVDASSAQVLRDTLHTTIDDHQRFPYTSSDTDTWDVLELADEDLSDSGRIVTLYKNESILKWSGGDSEYNREHTWPRSFGFPDNDASMNYPFTDMHHLFLANPAYNSARSNKPFENCQFACQEHTTQANNGRGGIGGPYPGDSNWTSGDFTFGQWEAWNARKGDMARAMMYMDVRYEGGTHGVTAANEPDLRLTDDRNQIDQFRTNQNEPIAYMGLLSTLLEWNREDPVDATEIQHHETVASFQGNRNPFIDHPEWAECIYLEICFSINAGLNDAWVSADAPFQGMFITVFPKLGLVFLAWFTFDNEVPVGGPLATFGANDQRWSTAVGSFDGNRAELKAELTSGGIFNGSDPLATQSPNYGTMILTFTSCNAGTVEYNFPDQSLSGTMPITRVIDSNVIFCESLAGE
jgi:endonuclease I